MKITITLLAAGLLATHVAGAVAKDDAQFMKGQASYKVNCTICHGDNGDGQGIAGKALKPPPRNYATDALKQGCSEADLLKTINKGVKNTAMAAFGHLPEAEKKAVAHYVFHNWINNKNPKCKKAWSK